MPRKQKPVKGRKQSSGSAAKANAWKRIARPQQKKDSSRDIVILAAAIACIFFAWVGAILYIVMID